LKQGFTTQGFVKSIRLFSAVPANKWFNFQKGFRHRRKCWICDGLSQKTKSATQTHLFCLGPFFGFQQLILVFYRECQRSQTGNFILISTDGIGLGP